MKAQQFAVSKSLTVVDWTEDQVGEDRRGWSLYQQGCQPLDAVLGGHSSSFFSP